MTGNQWFDLLSSVCGGLGLLIFLWGWPKLFTINITHKYYRPSATPKRYYEEEDWEEDK